MAAKKSSWLQSAGKFISAHKGTIAGVVATEVALWGLTLLFPPAGLAARVGVLALRARTARALYKVAKAASLGKKTKLTRKLAGKAKAATKAANNAKKQLKAAHKAKLQRVKGAPGKVKAAIKRRIQNAKHNLKEIGGKAKGLGQKAVAGAKGAVKQVRSDFKAVVGKPPPAVRPPSPGQVRSTTNMLQVRADQAAYRALGSGPRPTVPVGDMAGQLATKGGGGIVQGAGQLATKLQSEAQSMLSLIKQMKPGMEKGLGDPKVYQQTFSALEKLVKDNPMLKNLPGMAEQLAKLGIH